MHIDHKKNCLHQFVMAWCCLLCMLPCAHAVADNIAPNTQEELTRYVWGNNLILRAEPDSKSAEITRLPFGTAVTLQPGSAPLIKHQETVLKLLERHDQENNTPAANVTLDGNWQHVHANDHDGWLFDGYLSRYPAPRLANGNRNGNAESEFDYVKRIFGVKVLQEWNSDDGDSETSKHYSTMRKHLGITEDEDGHAADGINWTYVELRHGGSYENAFAGRMYLIEFKNLPLTFNEALLLWRHFDHIGANTNNDGSAGGSFKSGRTLEIYPDRDESPSAKIDCHGQTCNLRDSEPGDD